MQYHHTTACNSWQRHFSANARGPAAEASMYQGRVEACKDFSIEWPASPPRLTVMGRSGIVFM